MSVISKRYKQIGSIPMIIILIIMATACENRLIESPISDPITFMGDSLTITGSLNIPIMAEAKSRTLGELPKSDLQLTLFEFDYVKDNTSASFLTNVYKTEITEIITDEDDNTKSVKFKVTLNSASTPKVLHFMVANIEFSPSGYSSEASIIPSLSVGEATDGSFEDDPDAYWGRIVLEDGYNTLNENGEPVVNSYLKTKLTNVPLIRNFAKISVKSDVEESIFKLTGFVLMNVPTSGTVAPWIRSSLSTPDLLDGNNNMKEYTNISYRGILPAGVKFRNTEANIDNIMVTGADPQYIYEHPYESGRRTYIIIQGLYYNAVDGWQEGYYKIDIGEPDETTNNFKYYNIIRNIHYIINIKSVNAPGKSSLTEAIASVPFNNISAETETSSMLSISDGKNLLITNGLNHVIVDNSKPIEFMYRYIMDVDKGSGKYEENDYDGLDFIGLEPGDVIKSIAPPETITDDSGANWVLRKIYPHTPTPDLKTQEFTVIDGNGLGRTIHLILRSPWEYDPLYKENGINYYATVANGTANMYDLANPQPEIINSASGKPLTVYFNLPDGLPEAMFPLEFTIESKHQWIENNKIGTIVVTSGKSLFDENNIAIQYVKKVSYQEYCYQVNDYNVPDINDPNTTHTVRCRFLTIAEAEGEAEIRIHSPYFAPDASVIFERGDDTSDIL